MGQAEHTPGPWSVADDLEVEADVGLAVARCYDAGQFPCRDEEISDEEFDLEFKANARLIAAAPDYFAAAAVLAGDVLLPNNDEAMISVRVGDLRALQHAHAKAEGK